MSAEDPVAAARALAPRAAELAAETERERRVSPDFSAAMAEAGLYGLCVPSRFGGREQPPQVMVRALEELAAGDAAPAWAIAVCATGGMLSAYLPEETAAAVWSDPTVVVGGVFAPMGRAVPSDDGYDVDGRWRFASNCQNCDWLMGGCVVLEDGQPRPAPGGRPDVVLTLFPAHEVEIIDTWDVSGLRGTGSHDMAISGLTAPADRCASLITDPPRAEGPLYAFPPFGLLAIAISGVTLGIARAALDDLAGLAGAKTPTLSTRKLAERAGTQERFARAEASVGGARALLYAAIEAAWQAAQRERPIPRELRARLRLAATHAVEVSAAAVDTVYTLAGGSAIYEAGGLARRWRDVHAATQHMLIGPATWELTGRALLGLETDDSQL